VALALLEKGVHERLCAKAHQIARRPATLTGDRLLQCVLTLRAGEAVYNPTGLGLPEWQDAPDPYWWDPARKQSMRPSPRQ